MQTRLRKMSFHEHAQKPKPIQYRRKSLWWPVVPTLLQAYAPAPNVLPTLKDAKHRCLVSRRHASARGHQVYCRRFGSQAHCTEIAVSCQRSFNSCHLSTKWAAIISRLQPAASMRPPMHANNPFHTDYGSVCPKGGLHFFAQGGMLYMTPAGGGRSTWQIGAGSSGWGVPLRGRAVGT